jgi:hypothetical protein
VRDQRWAINGGRWKVGDWWWRLVVEMGNGSGAAGPTAAFAWGGEKWENKRVLLFGWVRTVKHNGVLTCHDLLRKRRLKSYDAWSRLAPPARLEVEF